MFDKMKLGDEVLIRAKVYEKSTTTGSPFWFKIPNGILLPDGSNRFKTESFKVQEQDIHSILPRPIQAQDLVITPFGDYGTVLAVDGEQAWVLVHRTNSKITYDLSDLKCQRSTS